jgi:hypothetical protein
MKNAILAAAAVLALGAGVAGAQTAAPAPANAPGSAIGAAPASPPAGGPAYGRMRHGGPLARLDANHDGQVTKDELLAAQQRQLRFFELADANHDGVVTRDEMRALREQWRARHHGVPPGQPVPPAAEPPSRG